MEVGELGEWHRRSGVAEPFAKGKVWNLVKVERQLHGYKLTTSPAFFKEMIAAGTNKLPSINFASR